MVSSYSTIQNEVNTHLFGNSKACSLLNVTETEFWAVYRVTESDKLHKIFVYKICKFLLHKNKLAAAY